MSTENISPKVLHALQRQLQLLQEDKMCGINIVQKDQEADDMAQVVAELSGPEATPYVGGTFVVKLCFPPTFPATPPKAVFLTPIFHPNISSSGEVCVNTLKRDWDPQSWSVEHLLKVIRCLLIVPFPESALNPEAARLFMESYVDFAAHARLITSVHAMRKARPPNDDRNTTNNSAPRVAKRMWKRL
eukprot:GEMP01049865.1.p1 GENE.GEMP01049865.1~~GEMP01049865.1.p1  ORF type:complete len:188 (+),score=36.03 GEMP01049865.1:202-765(+)